MTRLRKYEGVDAWYPDLLSAWKTSAGTHSRIGVRSSIVPGQARAAIPLAITSSHHWNFHPIGLEQPVVRPARMVCVGMH
jgi:hypothetical protein